MAAPSPGRPRRARFRPGVTRGGDAAGTTPAAVTGRPRGAGSARRPERRLPFSASPRRTPRLPPAPVPPIPGSCGAPRPRGPKPAMSTAENPESRAGGKRRPARAVPRSGPAATLCPPHRDVPPPTPPHPVTFPFPPVSQQWGTERRLPPRPSNGREAPTLRCATELPALFEVLRGLPKPRRRSQGMRAEPRAARPPGSLQLKGRAARPRQEETRDGARSELH